MPTYEYKCKACKHEFEKFQSITSHPVRKCPSCGKLRVERLIGTGSGIIFKGSGFYETDYKRAGRKSTECAAETKSAKPAEKSGASEASSAKSATESCKSCAKAESCPESKAGKE